MNFEDVSSQLTSYIDESRKDSLQMQELEEKLKNEVTQGMRGRVEAQTIINEKKNVVKSKLRANKESIGSAIQSFFETESKKIESSEQTVTTDSLAEITLLSELDLTDKDIEKYAIKYKNSPLILRKLEDISHSKGIFNTSFPVDKKDYLHTIIGRMETSLNNFSNPDYQSYAVKIDMKADGAIRSINEDMKKYKEL